MGNAKEKNLWDVLVERYESESERPGLGDDCLMDLGVLYPNTRSFLLGMPERESPIPGGTILLFVDAEGPKVMLKDRWQGRLAFVTAGTLERLLEDVEHGLSNGSLHWRVDKYKADSKQKGKK